MNQPVIGIVYTGSAANRNEERGGREGAWLLSIQFGPYLAPYPCMLRDRDRVAEPPSRDYLLGTDNVGRDMLSRIMWGAHTAGIVAIISTMFSLILGIILGGSAAYMGSWADWLISRAVNVTMSIPQLLFASPMAAIFRKPVSDWVDKMSASKGIEFFSTPTYVDLIVIFGALALIQWPGYARLIRGQSPRFIQESMGNTILESRLGTM